MVTSLYRNGKGHLNGCTQETLLEKSYQDLSSLPKTPLFGTDGIRGKAGSLLNANFALHLGFCAAQVLSVTTPTPGPIIIGQDSRNSSDMLAMAIAAGLTSAGLEVWQIGLCPTPCVAYLTRNSEAIGGIMISASHNPPEDNGIKFFDHQGLKLSKSLAQQIENLFRNTFESQPQLARTIPVAWGKHYHRQEKCEDYLMALHQSLPTGVDLQGMRIVLDLAWGASVEIAPKLLKALGAEVICLHDLPDGDRINVNCGSTHLKVLQETVKEFGADLGVAFDGDADRVLAVDSVGRIVDGDYILYFWGQTLKAKQQLPNNLIIATVMANLGFENAWRSCGGHMIRTSVGDQHVQAQMWETGAMLGGEQSGHIICHHHSVSGDGIQTALHLAALVRQSGLSLAQLVDQSFQTYPQILRNVRVEDRERRCNWQECEPLQAAIDKAESSMGEQGRILVRASGTEPLIRVMVESQCGKSANYWTEHLVGIVQQHLA